MQYVDRCGAKYLGKPAYINLYSRVSSLNSERNWIGSQWSFLSNGVVWVYLHEFVTILAAQFWIDCNLWRLAFLRLLKSELQYSNRLLTKALATDTAASWVKKCLIFLKSLSWQNQHLQTFCMCFEKEKSKPIMRKAFTFIAPIGFVELHDSRTC